MKSTPLNETAPMILAHLAGRKSETRVPVKAGRNQEWLTAETLAAVSEFEEGKDGWWRMAVPGHGRIVHCGVEMNGGHIGSVRCPFGTIGDEIVVREKWAEVEWTPGPTKILYAADDNGGNVFDYDRGDRWRSSSTMQRWASRIILTITSIKVERVQEITGDGCLAEGIAGVTRSVSRHGLMDGYGVIGTTPEEASTTIENGFIDYWNSRHGKGSWEANPFCWVIGHERKESK